MALTKSDRCDTGGCQAQAFYRATLLTGALDFCRHHYLKNEEVLAPYLVSLIDQAHEINHKVESSA